MHDCLELTKLKLENGKLSEYLNEQYVKLFYNPVTRGVGYHNDVVY